MQGYPLNLSLTPADYDEEVFGILTDDDLYLDCKLLKPVGLPDDEILSIRVWVPRYPSTKTSVVSCARQEAAAGRPHPTSAHLVFDLRGTGQSEGIPMDTNFDLDLESIHAWAEERFGDIKLAFLGLPEAGGQVKLLPIRTGVTMEHYQYEAQPADPAAVESTPIIYLSTLGNFTRTDDAVCRSLAHAGYHVFAMDPLRYLLHAATVDPVKLTDLWHDFGVLYATLPGSPIVIGRPVAAGLALLCAVGLKETAGVISVGAAQVAFSFNHIFDNTSSHTFFLDRHIRKIAPRPVALVRLERHLLGGEEPELYALLNALGEPRRYEETKTLGPELLFELLSWVQSHEAM